MKNSTTLLVGADTALIRFLSEVVQSTGQSALEVVPCVEDARAKAENDNLAIVIVHLRKGDDIREVARLRGYLTLCGSPGALLLICDEYRASEACDALLFGAIDYLPRPLDFNAVAFLIEMQVLRIMRRRGSVSAMTPARADRELRTLGSGMAFLYTVNSLGEHSPIWSAVWRHCHRPSCWGEKQAREKAAWRG